MSTPKTPVQRVEELETEISSLKEQVTKVTGERDKSQADFKAAVDTHATAATNLASTITELTAAKVKLAEVTGRADLAENNLAALMKDFDGKVLEAASKETAKIVAAQGLTKPVGTEVNTDQSKTNPKDGKPNYADLKGVAKEVALANGAVASLGAGFKLDMEKNNK
jgi:cell division septum initiation protein DivIVA